jgi:hypothetical protein
MSIDLTDEERSALVNMLTVEIEASKYPLSPRIEMLKRIRAKLRLGAVPPPEPPRSKGSSRK